MEEVRWRERRREEEGRKCNSEGRGKYNKKREERKSEGSLSIKGKGEETKWKKKGRKEV